MWGSKEELDRHGPGQRRMDKHLTASYLQPRTNCLPQLTVKKQNVGPQILFPKNGHQMHRAIRGAAAPLESPQPGTRPDLTHLQVLSLCLMHNQARQSPLYHLKPLPTQLPIP